MLIELDSDQLRTVTALFAAGAEYLRSDVFASPTEPVDGTPEQKIHWSENVRARFFERNCTLKRSNERPRCVFWSAAQPWNGEPLTLIEFNDEQLVHLLVTHQLAKDVSRPGEAEREARRFLEEDRWGSAFMYQSSAAMLSFPIETVAELHYALSNDRAVDGRSDWPCAAELQESRRRLTPEEAAGAVEVFDPSDDAP